MRGAGREEEDPGDTYLKYVLDCDKAEWKLMLFSVLLFICQWCQILCSSDLTSAFSRQYSVATKKPWREEEKEEDDERLVCGDE